jgi:hypothetical protein
MSSLIKTDQVIQVLLLAARQANMMGINGAFQNEPKSNKLTQKINRLFKEY